MKTRAVPNPVRATVSTGVQQVAKNNPDRLFLLVVNLSDTDLYLGWFADVSATKGILLAHSGGNAVLTAEEDGELVGYEMMIYSSADAKAIFVLEVEAE